MRYINTRTEGDIDGLSEREREREDESLPRKMSTLMSVIIRGMVLLVPSESSARDKRSFRMYDGAVLEEKISVL